MKRFLYLSALCIFALFFSARANAQYATYLDGFRAVFALSEKVMLFDDNGEYKDIVYENFVKAILIEDNEVYLLTQNKEKECFMHIAKTYSKDGKFGFFEEEDTYIAIDSNSGIILVVEDNKNSIAFYIDKTKTVEYARMLGIYE